MASGSDGNAGDVIEGLLCPMCMRDLGTIARLQDHFEQEHNSEEDKDVLQSLKDLIGKAKKKILSPDLNFLENVSDDSKNPFNNSDYFVDWETQELGKTRNHTQEFLKIRSNRMDCYAAETNKLIIRLDKILGDFNEDREKRRQHEQSVVPWVNDEDVKLCPQCAKSFNLIRRRHHCRLCGSVQCHQCSDFLLHSFARKLTTPGYENEAAKKSHTSGSSFSTKMEMLAFQTLRRTNSSSSLGSVSSFVDASTGEGQIRVCVYCKQLLGRRATQMDNHSQKSEFVELYEQLQLYMNKAVELLPIFLKMFESLSQGESNYHLKDAQECRLKLLKLTEHIDAFSKKIQSYQGDPEGPSCGTQLSLQQKVRLGAVNFLRDNLMGLPNLPGEEQVRKLQDQRRKLVEQKIAEEKMHSLQVRYSEEKRFSPSPRATESVSIDRGWGPQPKSSLKFNEDDDPMLQQMQIIKNYIQQARRDNKYDEVAMLEANLRELEEEYKKSIN